MILIQRDKTYLELNFFSTFPLKAQVLFFEKAFKKLSMNLFKIFKIQKY